MNRQNPLLITFFLFASLFANGTYSYSQEVYVVGNLNAQRSVDIIEIISSASEKYNWKKARIWLNQSPAFEFSCRKANMTSLLEMMFSSHLSDTKILVQGKSVDKIKLNALRKYPKRELLVWNEGCGEAGTREFRSKEDLTNFMSEQTRKVIPANILVVFPDGNSTPELSLLSPLSTDPFVDKCMLDKDYCYDFRLSISGEYDISSLIMDVKDVNGALFKSIRLGSLSRVIGFHTATGTDYCIRVTFDKFFYTICEPTNILDEVGNVIGYDEYYVTFRSVGECPINLPSSTHIRFTSFPDKLKPCLCESR